MTLNVGVVGAGIVGLAHAWSAAERGHRVTVFERSPRASGASIRNFGMIWPIGQPAGPSHATAMRSRRRWLEVASQAGIRVSPCGSIHLAHRRDEWNVLEEFAALAPSFGIECSLLSAKAVVERTPAANPANLLGGLFSSTELAVDPLAAVRAIPTWLSEKYGVQFEFSTAVAQVESGNLRTGDGRRRDFDRIIVGGGSDFATLFPNELAKSSLRLCKLQMLKTGPQANGFSIGTHVASGLTLRHYRNFEVCSSLAALKQRIATETPELDQYGIHVMASQTSDGCVILGDSHEYDADIEPFDKSRIDELMLRELKKVFALPEWNIAERWHGVYAKHPSEPIFVAEPLPNVFIRTGTGGAGMTMAFGLAENDWDRWS